MQTNEQPWYQINEIDKLDSPTLVIYVQRVKENIKKLINGIGDLSRLRPHVKTHKSSEVTKLFLAAGISKFKCATIAEAEMLALCNCKDVLLAYQPCGPKLERFIALQQKYPSTQFSCLIDDVVIAEETSAAALKNNIVISIYVDLNVGMNRTGIEPENASLLCGRIAELPHLKFVGLHAYDGHIEDLNMDIRTLRCHDVYDRVITLNKKMEEKGFNGLNLVLGGSPSFPIYSQFKDVTCSPGTFVFWDENYQSSLPEQDFKPAALVIGRIISSPSETILTVDIGHKAISSEYGLSHRIQFLNAPDLKVIGHSEEHLVLEAPKNNLYKIGDVLYGLPYHICPTCALHKYANIVQNHKLIGQWAIEARDRIITI